MQNNSEVLSYEQYDAIHTKKIDTNELLTRIRNSYKKFQGQCCCHRAYLVYSVHLIHIIRTNDRVEYI